MYQGLTEDEESLIAHYEGIRQEIHYSDKPMKLIDTRLLDLHKLQNKKRLWISYNQRILEAVPDYKQRNIALGLIQDPDKTMYLDQINTLIKQYKAAVSQLNACIDCDSMEAIG